MHNLKKKKIVSLFCTLLIMTLIIPLLIIRVNASDETPETESPIYCDGVWKYRVENGCAVLVGVTEIQKGKSCGPPSFLGGYPLTVIDGINCGAIAGIEAEQFIVPPGVQRFTQQSFNTGLFTSIVIPRSLTTIDFNAFPNCFYFTTIYYEGSPAEWEDIHIEMPGLSNKPVMNATKYFGYVYDDSYKEPFKLYDRSFKNNLDYYAANLNSSEYNPELANLLAALSAAAYNEEQIKDAYRALGFSDDDFRTHYSSIGRYDPNFCSYTIGFKDSELSNEKICLITVRGSASFSDWVYNFDILTAEEKHQGFFAPALVIGKEIGEILNDKGIPPNNVKYVITGHSRGAAVGNLLSVELMEEGINSNNIYNYNYACPDVACKSDFTNYDNIYNLCNTDDLVPFLPGATCNSLVTQGKSWGKYGQTRWFTSIPEKNGFFKSHSIDHYLNFFDEKLNVTDWPLDFESMASGVLTKIYCPVDVIVTAENGKIIASVVNGEINYYHSSNEDILIFTYGDKKFVYINEEKPFNVNLIGTDSGTMTFTVERCNLATGEVLESKTFSNVILEKDKTMYSPVSDAEKISDIELFVVNVIGEDKIPTYEIEEDGTESFIPCTHRWNDGKITKSATHTEYGETTYTCDYCNAKITEKIEKISEHTYGEWIKVDNSFHKHTCDCGESEIEKHAYGRWIVTRKATDTEAGIKEKTCSCGHSVTEEIPQINNGTNIPGSTSDSEHDNCSAGWFKSLWVSILNFFRRIFGVAEKCVCGQRLE